MQKPANTDNYSLSYEEVIIKTHLLNARAVLQLLGDLGSLGCWWVVLLDGFLSLGLHRGCVRCSELELLLLLLGVVGIVLQ